MGGCLSVSFSCDHVVDQISQWLGVKESYIHNLEENLTALEKNMAELKARQDDLSRRVEREEDKGLQRLAQIQVWLTRVEAVESQVNRLLSDRTIELQRLCICGCCSKNLKLSFRYGKSVFLMLRDIENLISNGSFEVVVEQVRASEVKERPIQSTIVGREALLENSWNWLMEDEGGIMGLYGMGGVGKTTLLTQINNKFPKTGHPFDIVIWVLVSKDLQIQKIQDEVAKKLGMAGEDWNKKNKDDKACNIHNILGRKKFVLLLDDIWKRVNLPEIGIPFPTIENGCKVVFTTRSQEVCRRMGVNVEMEVQCLAPGDALDLLRKKVGNITLGSHPGIPELADIVCKKCHGLPLALDVIGETMSCKRTIQEWQHAVDVLTSYAAEFSGMEEEILPVLKYSYDDLKGEQVKSCLLYCALFPEDCRISKRGMINYLICEGIIDVSEGMEKATNKGYEIIGSLIRASLLMEDECNALYEVYMHDVVREMALWIASEFGKQKDHFIVRAGAGLYEIPKVRNWTVVRRLSLMYNKIDNLSGKPDCLELITLFLQKNETLVNISGKFFQSMPRLVVLDLSENKQLSEIPGGISQLFSLQYLNLSHTRIHHLPAGLQELKKLIHLDLEFTRELSSIVGVSSLLNLKVLRIRGSGVLWDLNIVNELQVLEHLEILTIGFGYQSGLDQFLSSNKLTMCTQTLEISGLHLESCGISLPINMEKLRLLVFSGCSISKIKIDRKCFRSETISLLPNPQSLCFLSLSHVHIQGCQWLKELTLLMFAPNLAHINVNFSDQLEDIISQEKVSVSEKSGMVPFQKLEILRLNRLPQLQNIYWSPLPFSCLATIVAYGCPKLRKLPLNSKSGIDGEKGLVIEYREKEWIQEVEWEDEATKARFLPTSVQLF